MSDLNPRIPLASAAYYAALYPQMAEIARLLGYALAIHGSLSRDLDLIAVPWTEEAVESECLAEALRGAVGGFWAPHDFPATKPHGRRAWSIQMGSGPYIDLSVMPRK